MKLSRLSFFAAFTLLALTGSAHAQSLLYDISSSSGGSAFSGFDGNWGFDFTLSGPVQVDALGLWDEGSDGLAGAHQVGLFTSFGTLLASTTVDNSSTVVASANSNGRWLFTDLATPFSLSAGTYTLGFFNQSGATEAFRGSAATNFQAGASSVQGKARSGAPAFNWPDADSSPNGWYGPNLSVVVPEPGTVALIGLGILPLVGLVAKRRKA